MFSKILHKGKKLWEEFAYLEDLSFQMRYFMVISGLVRGGSGGSADPRKILDPVEKKLEIDILS